MAEVLNELFTEFKTLNELYHMIIREALARVLDLTEKSLVRQIGELKTEFAELKGRLTLLEKKQLETERKLEERQRLEDQLNNATYRYRLMSATKAPTVKRNLWDWAAGDTYYSRKAENWYGPTPNTVPLEQQHYVLTPNQQLVDESEFSSELNIGALFDEQAPVDKTKYEEIYPQSYKQEPCAYMPKVPLKTQKNSPNMKQTKPVNEQNYNLEYVPAPIGSDRKIPPKVVEMKKSSQMGEKVIQDEETYCSSDDSFTDATESEEEKTSTFSNESLEEFYARQFSMMSIEQSEVNRIMNQKSSISKNKGRKLKKYGKRFGKIRRLAH